MKTCNGCKNAEWDRTEKGRLHPSGVGRCGVTIKIPLLPNAFEWLGIEERPRVWKHGINRREEFKDHCPYYAPVKPEGGEK